MITYMNLIPAPKQRSLRARLLRAAASAAVITAAFGGSFVLGGAGEATMVEVPGGDAAPAIDRPSADPAAALLKGRRGQCWTEGQEPKAALPGHAIVTYVATGEAAYTARFADVDAAFSEALHAAGYGGEVSARLDVAALCV
jgi:hypothetical protein